VTAVDSGAPALVAPSAPLAGVASLRLRVAGTLDTLDPRGVAVAARAALRDVAVAGTRAARVEATMDVDDVWRGATGTFAASADSAALGGVPVDALTVRATLRGGLAEEFTAAVRTPAEARLTVAGGVSRSGDATRVRVDALAVRVDSGGAPPRGLSLAMPAVLALTPGAWWCRGRWPPTAPWPRACWPTGSRWGTWGGWCPAGASRGARSRRR
jgi:hypothetical protein